MVLKEWNEFIYTLTCIENPTLEIVTLKDVEGSITFPYRCHVVWTE